MIGMDEVTGRRIEGDSWLRQAVRRAIRTPKGTRPMLRWYGTNYLKYIAAPITNASLLELTGDLADSIEATIPGSTLQTLTDQKNGSEILISLTIGKEQKIIGV
jgi:phage baseplate assembly protein W